MRWEGETTVLIVTLWRHNQKYPLMYSMWVGMYASTGNKKNDPYKYRAHYQMGLSNTVYVRKAPN